MDSFIQSFDPITELGLPSLNSLSFSKIPPNFSKFPQNHPPPQMVVPTSNCSSRSSTPSIPPSNPFSTIRMPRKISSNTLEQYSPLTEDHRKLSLSSAIQKTKDGLGNMFGIDEQSPEDLIYNLFKVPNKSDAFIGKLIMVLKNHGLQENDPRLAPMMRKIREIESEKEEKTNEARDPKHWKLSKNDFKRVISESMSLIVQTMQGDLIVPAWGQFTNIIKEIYEECIPIEIGKVADYIPQLARMIPEHWGVSICTVDGQRASFGNSNIPFCVQSVSKAFNYGIAASEMGAEFVHQYVGQEPSGRLFNEICLDSNNKPHNPMVNSGAIIVTSLIQNRLNMADRFEHMINEYRKISGGEYVGFNNAVFLSESNTADRNFALAYFMKENGCFPPETHGLKEALDFYFQLCSLEVTCEGMAVMASTLANGGVCPLTGERCIGSRPCRDVLSLMNSCGMYDYSGQFAFHVGLPAKSGVSGVMIVVIPNLMGIALWSPPLDRMGNSVRGVEFCKRLIQRFNFHNYDSMVHNECPKFDPRHRIGERERAAVVSLLFAAKAADLNTIRRMYMQQVDLEMADYDKRTALHLAASEGHFDVALFLLEIGKVKPDPRDRWNRTPLDDAREARHTSVALLLERRMQELEQAKTIPAGRPINLASKANSLQMLPSQHGGQKGILHQSSSGTDLKEPLEIETAEMNGDGGLHRPFSMDFAEANEIKRRQVPPSPLGQNSYSAISPPLGREGNVEDSGLSSSSVESTISPTNGQYQGQREIAGNSASNGENKHSSSFRDQPHQNGIVHSNGEESGMQNGIQYSSEGKANGHFWADQGHRESKEGEMEEFEMRARAYSDENSQNPTPIFHLGQNSHSLEGEYFEGEQQMMGTPEYHGRTYSNGKRYWQEEKERIDEETNSRFGKKDRLEEEEGTDNSEDSDEEEEEDILAKKEEREGQMAAAKGGQQRIRTLSMQQFHRMPEYGNGNGHPRLTNHRIEQLKHYLI